MCSCKEADSFRRLKRIFSREILWYKENETNDDLLYDDSWQQFSALSRGDSQEILSILAEKT